MADFSRYIGIDYSVAETPQASFKFDDIIEQVAGVYPKILLEGAMDAGAWSCAMVAGLVGRRVARAGAR